MIGLRCSPLGMPPYELMCVSSADVLAALHDQGPTSSGLDQKVDFFYSYTFEKDPSTSEHVG